MAETAQGPLGYARADGKLCHRKFPVALRVQHLLELGHDHGVAVPNVGALPSLRFGQGADQGMKEVLLQCARDLMMRQQVRLASWRSHRLWCEGAGCRRTGKMAVAGFWRLWPGRLGAQERSRMGSKMVGRKAIRPQRMGPMERWWNWSGRACNNSMPLRMGTPLNMTEALLSTARETNNGAGPNEMKAMRGLIASTRSRRRRRMLTQVSRDLKGPGPVTTRLADTWGALTRKASGSVYVVVPHPIMCLRIHRIFRQHGGRVAPGLCKIGEKISGAIFSICRGRRSGVKGGSPTMSRCRTENRPNVQRPCQWHRRERREQIRSVPLSVSGSKFPASQATCPSPACHEAELNFRGLDFRLGNLWVHPAASPFLHSQERAAEPTLAASLVLREVSL